MIVVGWGRKSRAWNVKDGKQLIATWLYLHVFRISVFSGKPKWVLQGHDRREDEVLTYDEVKRRFPENTPKIGWWR